MSLEDLEIRKHTAPLSVELDRQKEKAAQFKRELGVMTACRDVAVRANCQTLDRNRDLLAALRSVLDRCAKEYCGGNTPCGQCEVARAAIAKESE